MKQELILEILNSDSSADDKSAKLTKSINDEINVLLKDYKETIKSKERELSELNGQLLEKDALGQNVTELQNDLNQKDLVNKLLTKWGGVDESKLQDAVDLYTIRSQREGVDADALFEEIASKFTPEQPVTIEAQAEVSTDDGVATAPKDTVPTADPSVLKDNGTSEDEIRSQVDKMFGF